MPADPYKYFRVEAAEIVLGLEKGVLALEQGAATSDVAPEMLRLAHTLKGAARVVKHLKLATLAHSFEDVIAPIRDRKVAVERAQIDAALVLLDAMRVEVALLTSVPTNEGAATPTQSAEVATVRADLRELDALIEGLAETDARLSALRAAVDVAGFDKVVDDELARVEREVRLVREAAENMRLMPAASVLATLERTARDVALTTNKRVTFVTKGGDVRLDAHVLSVAQAALVQLVRNAIAHGIESERDRVAAGKSGTGTVEILVARRGRRALLTCKDDGRGVDLEAVRRAARERGLADGDARALGPEALLRLLMKGGLTTARAVSEIAGRGVGLDVVREAAARLGGEVQVRSVVGQGTSFEISVPISTASIEALCIEAAGIQAAIPIDAVRHSMRVESKHIAHTASGETIVVDTHAVPFVRLATLFGRASVLPTGSMAWPTIVVDAGGSSVAIAVDRLFGSATIVLRPLSPLAHADPVVAAVSLDPAGDPRLVLDPEALVAAALVVERPPLAATVAARAPLLVIDDSLTTRMLEQSILESAGYEVDVASSAIEGLEKARHRRYGIFLVDVEMPGMDGFTFVEKTRADPVLRATPAILVTSCSSPADRQRGVDAGASAYIVKGEFDQTSLLGTIHRLLGAS
ncbi:MAG: CheA signal transduction histidine kinase [Myxococcaceae bacterium]|nr:CheA signal transduction histidine kinase [Myxococcaceae bacterium]